MLFLLWHHQFLLHCWASFPHIVFGGSKLNFLKVKMNFNPLKRPWYITCCIISEITENITVLQACSVLFQQTFICTKQLKTFPGGVLTPSMTVLCVLQDKEKRSIASLAPAMPRLPREGQRWGSKPHHSFADLHVLNGPCLTFSDSSVTSTKLSVPNLC